MRRAILCLLVLALPGGGGAAALAAFTATTTNPGNSFSAAATFSGMRVATGFYTGNGGDNRNIPGVNFQADLVIVKGNNAQSAVARSSSVGGDLSKPLAGAAGVASNLIQAIGATTFQVGSNAAVNASGVRYDWVAFRNYAGHMTEGLYQGNGSGQSITGLGFSPDYVLVAGAGNTAAVQRSSSMSAAFRYDETAAAANGITALGGDGFSVGDSAETNQSGQTYAYVAWNEIPGLMEEGSYVGAVGDDRNIAASLQPDYVMVRSGTNGNACDRGVQRPSSLPGDNAQHFTNVANTGSNVIQALQATGFQVGSDCKVNTNGNPYYWVAFRNGG
ncbi:MAG: DUF7483 domain-containing protein [Thermoleophilaceae bacterium]